MRYTFIGFLFFISSVQIARSQKMTELEKAFMNTYDSTLVLTGQNPGGLWVRNAFIVSKKDSIISCYLYHFNVYNLPSSQRIPKGMADYLKAKDTYPFDFKERFSLKKVFVYGRLSVRKRTFN